VAHAVHFSKSQIYQEKFNWNLSPQSHVQMPVPSYAFLSATAGLAGSLASVSAKFVFGALPEFLNDAEESSLPVPSSVLSGIFRVIFIITTILMNGVMWAFYMKALSVSGNSLQVNFKFFDFFSKKLFYYSFCREKKSIIWQSKHSLNQSINQSINRLSNQPMNQINQSINQSKDQSIN
jgi:hypothetical protein